LKKKKTAKAGAKKEEKSEPSPALKEEEKPESEVEPSAEDANGTDDKEGGNDAEDTVAELAKTSTAAQQSRMRSSSFRQSSSGLPSPGYGFPTDGDTAPAIYQKQATKIEELEKEIKRLAKEASDSEKRWKKAEDELEDLRDADSPVATKSSDNSSTISSGEVEKLVGSRSLLKLTPLMSNFRRQKSQPYNAKMLNFKHNQHDAMSLHHLFPEPPLQIMKPL